MPFRILTITTINATFLAYMEQNKKSSFTRFLAGLLVVIGGFGVILVAPAYGQLGNTNSGIVNQDLSNFNLNVPIVNENTNTAVDPTTAPEIADINSQIDAKKKRIEELRQQAALLQQSVDQAVGQVRTISDQVKVIDQQVAETSFSINIKKEEISSLELEMSSVQQSIDEKNNEQNELKTHLAQSLVDLDRNSRTSTLALILTHSSLAEYYDQAQAVTAISDDLQRSVAELQAVKKELQAKVDQLGQNRDDFRQSKLQLEIQKQSINEQKDAKVELLTSAQSEKNRYNELQSEAAREEQQANATISLLEKQLQDRLNANSNGSNPVFSSTGYIWPIASNGISAYYHDPDYPFRKYIGEHTGVDMRASQGTPVRSVADGIVSVVHNQGFYTNAAGQKTRSALNFVGIIHGDGISSRYLHLSSVYVGPDQFVRQGEVIGLSGGLPGTAGAGGITTGAHLHFEIRVDGIPDDPLKYLP